MDPKRFREEEHPVIYAGVTSYICPQRGFQDYEKEQVLCTYFRKHYPLIPLTTQKGHLKNSAPYIDRNKIVSPGFTDGAMVRYCLHLDRIFLTLNRLFTQTLGIFYPFM